MHCALLTLFILGILAYGSNAAPEPAPELAPVKGDKEVHQAGRSQQIPVSFDDSDEHLFVEHRRTDDIENINDFNYDDGDEDDTRNLAAEAKARETTARLFLRRFMRLKNNLFGNKQQRFIIQIFPNGTSSVTTVPTSTNVVVPPASITSPTGVLTPTGILSYSRPLRIANNGDNGDNYSTAVVAGTISDQRKGTQRDQDIFVRIPAEYKHLFNNGQKIVLNTKNITNKKRTGTNNSNKKRVNQNRKRVNNKNNNNKMKNPYLQRTHIITL